MKIYKCQRCGDTMATKFSRSQWKSFWQESKALWRSEPARPKIGIFDSMMAR